MRHSTAILFLLLTALVLVFFTLNLLVGSVQIPFHDVVSILVGQADQDIKPSWQFIVLQSRLPQALTATLSGGALAVSGLMLQTAFRNPLAGPSIFGINSGAGLGVALVMLWLGGSISAGSVSATGFVAVLLAAFMGAMGVMAVIFLFSTVVKGNVMLLIIGIMIGYVANSVITLLNFFATDEGVRSYMVWGMGSFGGVSNKMLPSFAVVTLLALGASLLLIKPLNALMLGERYAENLGVNMIRTRNWLLVITGILTAIVTFAVCAVQLRIAPAPFNLKYLGLGNEEKISPEFAERFKYMYERVTKAHPEIVIVGTAGPGSHPDNPDFQAGWKLADETAMPIIDEHYYEPNNYFLSSRQYDYYPRDRKTKVYLGEYASKDKKLIDALAEGLYLLHVERNADVVCMTSYAPLFARKNATNWNPDMIYFDNERPYLTCSYYVQQLFGQSSGNYYYGDCVTIENPDVAPRWEKLPQEQKSGNLQDQSVVLNTKTRQLFVKLCNASGETKKANINLSRFGLKKMATKITIAGNANDENNYEAQPIVPVKEQIKAQKKFSLDLAPYSFVMLQYSL